jgi:hypothetical protein
MLYVLVLAALIYPIALLCLFADQENVASTRTATVDQGDIMVADNDVVKETKTTTERPTIEEKRTNIKTTTETKYWLSQHKVQQSAGNGPAGLIVFGGQNSITLQAGRMIKSQGKGRLWH